MAVNDAARRQAGRARVPKGRPPSSFLSKAEHWSSGHTDTASKVKAVMAEALDAKFPRPPTRAARRAKP